MRVKDPAVVLDAAAPTRPARTVADRLLGVLGGAMIVAALVLLVFGGEGDTGVPPGAAAAPPPLELLAPADGDVSPPRVELRFRAPAEMRQAPGGWGTGSLHLHLGLDGAELMPAPGDVRIAGGGEYLWTVGPLQPGEHRARLFWSGPDHRALPEGGSREVVFRVR